jgi:5,10-methylenetetrahydromethanopterin reductase
MANRVRFGLNRWNFGSAASFALDVKAGEEAGWDLALIPSSPLLVADPYIMLSFAARGTDRIGLGPFVESPVMRHPAVLASSIATLDEMAPERALLTLGSGDTSVRLMGKQPAKVAELEAATTLARRLLAGDEVEPGAREPARLRNARPVPVWIAAGGPKTLRMAGRVADGVFIRVGAHEANLKSAVEAVREGAREAGRHSSDVEIGLVFHTLMTDDHAYAQRVGRSVAAGFHEYSPMLFDGPGLSWDGPPVETLREQVWPDFHHASDLATAGDVVDFLPQAAIDAFMLSGSASDIRHQLRAVLDLDLDVSTVVVHRLPGGGKPASGASWKDEFAREVIERLEPIEVD